MYRVKLKKLWPGTVLCNGIEATKICNIMLHNDFEEGMSCMEVSG